MSEIFLGFFGGLVAWFASSFLGEPLTTLLGARRDAQKGLYFYANVLPENDARFLEAIIYFRRIGAEIEGLKCSLFSPVFRLLGFHLDTAVVALTGFSNSLSEIGEPKIAARIRVQRALRLPIAQVDLDSLEKIKK